MPTYAPFRTSAPVKSTNREDYQNVPRPVGAMAKNYGDGYVSRTHQHPRAQLLYAVTGVMEVATAEGLWVVPPQRAVWLPPNTDHSMRARGAVALRTLYVRPDAYPVGFPIRPRIVHVSALLRELVVRAVEMPVEYDEAGREGRAVSLIFDEIAWLPDQPLHLPTPKDKRLAAIHSALLAEPADGRTLDQWGSYAGASARTLARLCRAECGTSFLQWRQQHRILAAMPRLAAGEAVTSVALDLGYETPGAFAAMFRRLMGMVPSRYFEANPEDGHIPASSQLVGT